MNPFELMTDCQLVSLMRIAERYKVALSTISVLWQPFDLPDRWIGFVIPDKLVGGISPEGNVNT